MMAMPKTRWATTDDGASTSYQVLGAVHIGARFAALAGPSEVLVSSTVKDLVAGSGLVSEGRCEHALKGVPDKWLLYATAPTPH